MMNFEQALNVVKAARKNGYKYACKGLDEHVLATALMQGAAYQESVQRDFIGVAETRKVNGPGKHGAKSQLGVLLIPAKEFAAMHYDGRVLKTWGWQGNGCLQLQTLLGDKRNYGAKYTTWKWIPIEGYNTYKELPLDPSECQGKRARTFEKVCRAAIQHQMNEDEQEAAAYWIGALLNSRADIVVVVKGGRKLIVEIKGVKGRDVAFVPSSEDTND